MSLINSVILAYIALILINLLGLLLVNHAMGFNTILRDKFPILKKYKAKTQTFIHNVLISTVVAVFAALVLGVLANGAVVEYGLDKQKTYQLDHRNILPELDQPIEQSKETDQPIEVKAKEATIVVETIQHSEMKVEVFYQCLRLVKGVDQMVHLSPEVIKACQTAATINTTTHITK